MKEKASRVRLEARLQGSDRLRYLESDVSQLARLDGHHL
jgi:hypothetical protein